MMDEAAIAEYITNTLPEVESSENFGYTFFFYRDDHRLPFATIASSDNEYEQISKLDRPGVFRLNIGVAKQTFQSLFGLAEISVDEHDFAALDRIMPHPDYWRQFFVCVLNPSEETWQAVRGFLEEAYEIAKTRYQRKAGAS